LETLPLNTPQLRLRVFAGPNGSGKSTVIKEIRETRINGKEIDFGVYINADDIAKALVKNTFSFKAYEIECTKDDILEFASSSGLISKDFTIETLDKVINLSGSKLKLLLKERKDNVAQIVARFLREALLLAKKRFSFETVFSHESNLEIMEKAVAAGYKVYLYFVSTESPEINKYRVALRVRQGGHPVPEDRIVKRYYKALELLHDAAAISYQAFFFDNTMEDEPFKLVGHFKNVAGIKKWDIDIEKDKISNWFRKYYLNILKGKGENVPI
jgi:predicted ABC-type ATPase